MTRIEILEEIIRQNGNCAGILCATDKCPLSKKFGNGLCANNEENLKTAKAMLAEEKNKEKMEAGSNVVWNGRKDSKSLIFLSGMEKFLKSKEVHTIKEINNNVSSVYCKLEGDDKNWYALKWLDLVEKPKAKLHIFSTPSSHVESRIEQSFFPKKGIEITKHDLVNCVCWINRNKVEKEVKKMKTEDKKQRKLEVLEEHKEWLESKMKSQDSLELRKELTRVKLAIINLKETEC